MLGRSPSRFGFLLLLLVCLQWPDYVQAQDKKPGKLLREARRHTLHGRYDEARKNYLELVRRYPEHPVYNYELGLNYFQYTVDNKAAAIPYFEMALAKSKPGDTLPELFYLLGETHHLAGNYDEAAAYFDRFKPFIKEDSEEGKQLESAVNVSISQISQASRFTAERNDTIIIENLGFPVNTQYPEYAPLVNREESIIMFTSRRAEPVNRGKDAADELYFEDIFVAQGQYGFFDSPVPFSATSASGFGNINRHDALVSLSADSTTLLTYRDNKLWRSQLTSEGTWSAPVLLTGDVNLEESYTPHGVITADGNRMYFSSERSGGEGGLDLYVSVRNEDNSWGVAQNLGELINTRFDEDAPYLTADGNTLYFASRGHSSMGGYDLFRSRLIDGQWSRPENLGAPINTPADEIYYSQTDTFVAYYASSRPGGLGGMDIYRVLYRPRPAFIAPEILTAETEEIVTTSGTRLRLLLPEKIETGQMVEVNPDLEIPEGYKVQGYYWRMPDGSVKEGEKVSFNAGKTGADSIILEVLVTNDDGVLERLTVVKPFNVGAPEFMAEENTRHRLRLLMPENIRPGQLVAVNPDFTVPEGYTVEGYNWILPGGNTQQGQSASFKASDFLGTDSVRLELFVRNANGDIETIRVVKPFMIGDKDVIASSGFSSGTRLRLLMPEEIRPGQEIAVNPDLYLPAGYKVQGFLWELPNGEQRHESTALFTAPMDEGTDSITLEVLITNEAGRVERITVTYPFQVSSASELLAEAREDEYLSSGTKLRLLMPEVVKPGEAVAVNPELSVPDGYRIMAYNWQLPDGSTSNKSRINFTAPNVEGTDSVSLDVMIVNSEGVMEKITVAYPFKVSASGHVAFNQPVYFDLNKSEIDGDAAIILRNYALQLKENPSLKVEIEAHADVRGASSYNDRLTVLRAKSVQLFLIRNGVKNEQIVRVVGKGEAFPLNHCTEGVPCEEKDHAVNRRAILTEVQ